MYEPTSLAASRDSYRSIHGPAASVQFCSHLLARKQVKPGPMWLRSWCTSRGTSHRCNWTWTVEPLLVNGMSTASIKLIMTADASHMHNLCSFDTNLCISVMTIIFTWHHYPRKSWKLCSPLAMCIQEVPNWDRVHIWKPAKAKPFFLSDLSFSTSFRVLYILPSTVPKDCSALTLQQVEILKQEECLKILHGAPTCSQKRAALPCTA